MIDSTAGVKEDVSTEGASAGATTVGNVTSGDASGANDAALASCTASVEADFRKATRDDERLPFWPIPEVGGLFELFMAIVNRAEGYQLIWNRKPVVVATTVSKSIGYFSVAGFDSFTYLFLDRWLGKVGNDGKGIKTPSCDINVV